MKIKFYIVISIFSWSFLVFNTIDAKELSTKLCREKNMASTISKAELAECIENHLYDPCHDATGKAGAVNCFIGHTEVEKRRIDKLTKKISKMMHSRGIVFRPSVREDGRRLPARNYLIEANKIWSDYVWEQCSLINALYDKFDNFEEHARCTLRLYRQRADRLNEIYNKMLH